MTRVASTALRALLPLASLLLAASPCPAEAPLAPAAAADEAVAKLREGHERTRELEAALASATGRQRQLLEEELWQHRVEGLERLTTAVQELQAQQEAGGDVAEARRRLDQWVREGWRDFARGLRLREARVEELLAEEGSAEAGSPVEAELWAEQRRLAQAYRSLVQALVLLEPLDVDTAQIRAFATEQLDVWADRLLAETRLSAREVEEAVLRAKARPEDADRQAALQVAEERLDHATGGLSTAVELRGQLGLPNSRYEAALIETTGEITREVLDVSVAMSLLRRMRDRVLDSFASGGPSWLFKALVFVLILVAFRAAAQLTRRFVERSMSASKLNVSQLLRDTVVAWSARVVMLVGLLVAISQLGVEIGALLAGLGIAGFVLGFALQDTLSNFAAGAMILLYRPFDVGDLIEAAGVRGAVQRMTLVSTTILTVDNQTLIIPNNRIWGDVIRNVTAQRIRRVDLVFGVGYGEDVDRVDAVLRDILAKHPQVLDEPEPMVEVSNLGESSVDFVVRPWVKTEDYWKAFWSITREVKKRFDREGIQIPFPQRDVHHYVERAAPKDEA